MTLYVTTRAGGGSRSMAKAARLIEGDGRLKAPGVRFLDDVEIARKVAGKTVVFTIHGFNVSYDSGLRSLARLEDALARRLPGNYLVVGVLWPGDFIVPAINYPGEWRDAVDSGRLLAQFVNAKMRGAADVCFLSHSLGGRLALEAVAHLDRKATHVCLTAAATDNDCLEDPYDVSVANSDQMTYLASKKDVVLKLAYPIGDWAGDVFVGDDDSALRGALGRHGARWPRTGTETVKGQRLPDSAKYGHGSYFPSGDFKDDPAGPKSASSDVVARFAAYFFTRGARAWPPPSP